MLKNILICLIVIVKGYMNKYFIGRLIQENILDKGYVSLFISLLGR